MNKNNINALFAKLNRLYFKMNEWLNRNGKTYCITCKEFDDTIKEIHSHGIMTKFDWDIDGIRYFPATNENGKENFTFRVTKTFHGNVMVSADSEEEAKAKAIELLKNGEISMSEPVLEGRCTSTQAE